MLIFPNTARWIVVFAWLCLLPPGARGEEWEAKVDPLTPGTFPEPRPLRVRYNFGWSGFSAATTDVQLKKLRTGIFRFEGTGRTTGLARTLWAYDVSHTALVDAVTLRPLRLKDIDQARSKQTTTELTFSPEGVTSVREQRKGGAVESKTRRFDFPNVLSLNAALLFLRTQPFTDGAVYRVVVYPATSAYLCTLTVLGREKISVPTGRYEAIKLDLKLSRIGENRQLEPYKKFRNATVWLSEDVDRLLLRVEAQIFIGKVFAELQSVQFDGARP